MTRTLGCTLVLCLAGCGGRIPPASDVGDPEPHAREPIPGPRTPEECVADAAQRGLAPGCRFTVVEEHYCGGTPSPYEGYGTHRVCVCNECLADADCADGGRCVSVASASFCSPGPRNLCVAPTEPCFPGTTCPEGTSCLEQYGEPVCGTMSAPPP